MKKEKNIGSMLGEYGAFIALVLLAVTMRYGRANWDALNAKNEK